VDSSQDYELLLGYENGTHTVIRFRRRYDTCDPHDHRITVRCCPVWDTSFYCWTSHFSNRTQVFCANYNLKFCFPVFPFRYGSQANLWSRVLHVKAVHFVKQFSAFCTIFIAGFTAALRSALYVQTKALNLKNGILEPCRNWDLKSDTLFSTVLLFMIRLLCAAVLINFCK
jgi:hypothetical protein